MKTMSKQMISFLLAILLCFSVLPMPALATAGEAPAEEPQQDANSGIPEDTESPAVESTPTPGPTPDPEPTPTPTPAPDSEGTEETPVEAESPDAQDEPQETPTPTEQEEELPPYVDEAEELLPVEEIPETAESLATEEPLATSPGLHIQPVLTAVVDEPLVKVVYQYGSGLQIATPSNLAVSSSHSYYTLGMVNGDSMEITANHFPGEIPTNAENLTVLLDGSMDVTMDAEYDPSTGKLYLPARYMGHRVTVTWTLEESSITDITISALVNVYEGRMFSEQTHALTLPSNALEIAIPLEYGSNPVVSQNGIDLPESAYSIEDGVLYVQASPLGGDLAVTAYLEAPQMRMFAMRSTSSYPTQVVHTRSADQIWYGYYTSYYTANGNTAFCLDPTVSGLNAGTYDIDYWITDTNDFLVKCCYYLYGGPGYDYVKQVFAEPDALWAYGMCHAVASYGYMGSLDAFKGLDDTLTGQLVQVANIVNSLPAVPSGFAAFVYNSSSSSNQPLIGWQYNPSSWEPDPWEPEPEPEPDPTGSVAVRKVSADTNLTDGNPCYSLAGAVFDVYSGSSRVGSITTNANGYGSLSGLPVGSGYSIVERTPPTGFAGTNQEYSFTIYEDDTTTVTVSNIPQNDPTTIMVRKQDADTGKAEPQGGAGLEGAQFTVKYYKGSYSSASALSGATPARTWVIETDEDGFAMLHPDYLVSGDAFYYNSAGTIVTLPLGTVTIQETKAPEGYLINNELFIRQITASGSMESVETYNEPIVKESVIRGGVSVEKWDAQLNKKGAAQGDATLAGAVLEIVNKSDSSVVVGGKTYGPGQVVHTLTTDESGAASTANDLLPYGEYEIVEKTAPTGYLNTGTVRRSFEIRTNGAVVNLTTADTAIKNDVIRGGVSVEKWDVELDRNDPQGDAILSGAVFEIYNRSKAVVVVGGKEYAPGAVVHTLTTGEDGSASTEDNLLPYGTYEIVEKTAPTGYLNTGAVRRTFTIRENGKIVEMAASDTAIKNNVICGGVSVEKWDMELDRNDPQGDATLSGAVLEIYNRSANSVVVGGKEYAPGVVVHTLTTDEGGSASTANDLLPYGTYEIVEKAAPTGYLNTGAVQRTFTIRENGEVVEMTAADTAIKNDVIRGGVSVEKWDMELDRNDPQGDATLAGAVFEIYNRSQNSMVVGGKEYDPGAVVHTLTTGEDGSVSTENDLLPYGTYEIVEKTAPTGYLNTGIIRRTFTIREDGKVVEMNASDTAIKNNVIRGGVEIEKWDIERNEAALKQGDATLAGAVLDIYNTSKYLVLVGGVEYAPGEIVLTLTTDEHGYASTAADALPYGSYEIVERTAPVGYLNSGVIRQGFRIREHGVIVSMTTGDTVIKNDIIRGNVLIEKWDNEIGEHRAQGGGTLEGATFEIVNRSLDSVLVQDVLYAPGEVVYTTVTDETGTAYTPEFLLPYGTFEAREISPTLEGYLSTGVLSRFFEIREHGKTVELNTAETAIRNDPLRGDLKGIKIADGTAQRLAGVPFSITSKTTGESHIVVTDVNGEFSTASEWNPHSQNTNAGQTDRDGVWFGELDVLDDSKGALLYDDYIIEELPCEANEGFELLSFEVSVYRHNTVIDLGTLTDDYIPIPEIFTTALEKESMGNTAYAAEKVTIVDTVYYSGLKAGTEYTLKGVLMGKATGEPLMVNESQVTAEKTFRATGESGSTTMEFTFDASALKGKAVVVFENLYLEDKEIASHADIEDTDQTITFLNPEIGTTAAGENGEKTLDATAETVIVDTVAYTGLQPGQEYTLKGQLMDKATGEAVQVDGQPVTAETTFTPKSSDGSVTVTFTLNAISLKGKSVVVFESLLHNSREIAIHADIEDEGQTVSFNEPKIGTKATGKDGKKELSLSAATTIVDTVKYENLAVGQEYTLKGVLMDKSTGKPVIVGDKEVTAQTIFKPEQANDTVDVTFTFDASSLKAKEVVVFERLYIGDAEIAAHADIEDKDQTVSVTEPKIGTSASGKDGEKQLAISKAATIIDKVKYEGLTIGEKYTLKGVLMDKATGKALLVDGKAVTAEATFTPEKADGAVEVTFTFDASGLKGKEIVVFERLYIGENEIAAHTDIEDKNQTVSFTAYAMKLTKIDRATNKPLDGAEFTLYGEDGKEIKLSRDKDGAYIPDEKGSAIISTVDGVAIIKDLTDQKYTLREVTVPKGYVGYTEPIPFEMETRDTEDDPFPVTVYNSPEGHKEGSGAKTGRDGLPMWALYGGVGLLALAAGVGVLYLRKRKMN